MRSVDKILIFLVAMLASATSHAQLLKPAPGDWPWWRGPNYQGTAEAGQQPAVEWSDQKNVAWRTSVPGRGYSSPTVVGNRIFLTTADEKARVQSVLCFDRKKGKQLWRRDVNRGGLPLRINRKNTHASPTIACDGSRLFAVFYCRGGIQVAALDLNGKLVWEREAGRFDPQEFKHGYGASPLLYGEVVIIAGDYDGDAFLTALDRKTGKTAWRTKRPSMCNYSSPIVGRVAGRDQLLISGSELVASYNPQNGKLLWKTPATTQATVGTVVWDGDLVFAAGGYPRPGIACIRADGSGEVVWKNTQRIYEQSMLVLDGHLFTINDAGIAYCWKADTGVEMWAERLRGPVSSSPILAGDNIYISNEHGTTWVFQATPERFTLIAKNQLGSEAFASPAICGNQIFIRVADRVDERHQESLYCIEPAYGTGS